MKKITHLLITMLFIAIMSIPTYSVFASETNNSQQITNLDYTIYNKDGTVAETGTIPNGNIKSRWSTYPNITLKNDQYASIMPSGTNGLFAVQGTRITFSYSLNRVALHCSQLRGEDIAYIYNSGSVNCSGITCYPTATISDYYHAWIRNYSSDPITITGVTISY